MLLMAPSTHLMPRSLTHPGGAFFLDPAHRVTREELDRRDARWRALRERAYQRAWSDDATLVGSIRYYAAASARQRSAASILSEEQQQQRSTAAAAAAATRLMSVEEDFDELCSVASTTTPYTQPRHLQQVQAQAGGARGSTPSVRSVRTGRRAGNSSGGAQRIRNAFKKWVNSKRQ